MSRGRVKPNYRRRSLRLPDLDHCKRAVLNSLSSPASRRVYEYAIDQFIAWYCSEPRLSFNKAVVTRYRIHLESLQLAPGHLISLADAAQRPSEVVFEAPLLGLCPDRVYSGWKRTPKRRGSGTTAR